MHRNFRVGTLTSTGRTRVFPTSSQARARVAAIFAGLLMQSCAETGDAVSHPKERPVTWDLRRGVCTATADAAALPATMDTNVKEGRKLDPVWTDEQIQNAREHCFEECILFAMLSSYGPIDGGEEMPDHGEREAAYKSCNTIKTAPISDLPAQ